MSNFVQKDVINVAIIGAGEMAMTVHLPTLLLCHHMFKTVALVDVSEQSLAHCAAKFHVSSTYTSVDTMLESHPEVDAVMISNAQFVCLTAPSRSAYTSEYHVQHAVKCLEAGKHVFIEKPMSLTLDGADEIIAAQKKSRKTVFVGYMRRYATAFLRVKEMVQNLPPKGIAYVRVRDIIGQVRRVSRALEALWSKNKNPLFISQGGWFAPRFQDIPKFANEERLGLANDMFMNVLGKRGSASHNQREWLFLNSLATHDVSAMRELIGMPQKVVSATRSPDGRFVTVTFQYDGFVAYYETGIDDVRLFDAHIELYTVDKRFRVNYDTPFIKGLPITATILSSRPNGDHSEETIRPTYEDAYTLEYKDWYSGMRGEKAIKTTAEDARIDTEILLMIMNAFQ